MGERNDGGFAVVRDKCAGECIGVLLVIAQG